MNASFGGIFCTKFYTKSGPISYNLPNLRLCTVMGACSSIWYVDQFLSCLKRCFHWVLWAELCFLLRCRHRNITQANFCGCFSQDDQLKRILSCLQLDFVGITRIVLEISPRYLISYIQKAGSLMTITSPCAPRGI